MIGLFGGTFDPIHYGHLRSALEVQEVFELTQVRLIPSATPPHRAQPQVSAQQRSDMVKLAIANLPNFVCDERELKRDGYSYMVDTLASLRADFPSQPLLLFIGTDAFNGLTRWHQWQRLFDYAHIVVMTRPSFQQQTLDDFFASRLSNDKTQLQQQLAGCLYFQHITQLDVSASFIRQLIAEKRNPKFLLPDSVLDFVAQHQLYL